MAQVFDLMLHSWHNIFGPYSWWQLLIQWLMIGLVVYWVIRFLRGTRGARLLKGIAAVLIFLYLIIRIVGNRLGLDQLVFLCDLFLRNAWIAIVVVFQPELRRAIMRLGETRLFRGFHGPVAEEVNELVQSAIYLSKRKIGALIAIERAVGLGGIAESGTRLNADLTSKLLTTIFYPNSPLHDLGVIISQGRIAYAGVEFPMAEEGTVERDLGSRHRASVGLSNETDALVIVVSEQTGDISIAERGVLFSKLMPDTLREMLTELLGAVETKTFESSVAADSSSPSTAAGAKPESELVEK